MILPLQTSSNLTESSHHRQYPPDHKGLSPFVPPSQASNFNELDDSKLDRLTLCSQYLSTIRFYEGFK